MHHTKVTIRCYTYTPPSKDVNFIMCYLYVVERHGTAVPPNTRPPFPRSERACFASLVRLTKSFNHVKLSTPMMFQKLHARDVEAFKFNKHYNLGQSAGHM